MDVGIVLFGATAGTIVSRRLEGERLLTISAVLSISLFSISLLELVPPELCVWTSPIAIVYQFILLATNLHCFVVIPTAVCLSMMNHYSLYYNYTADKTTGSTMIDEEEHKKRSFRRNHWIKWYIYRPMIAIAGTLLQVVFYFWPWYRSSTTSSNTGTGSNTTATTTLPLTAVNNNTHNNNSSPAKKTASFSFATTTHYYYDSMCTTPVIRKRMVLAMIVGSSVTFFALSRIRPWVFFTSQDETLLQIATSALCAVGILLSSVLNGFGSVSLPYSCCIGFFLHPVSDTAIRNAEQELEAVRIRLERPVTTTNDAQDDELRRTAESEFLLSLLSDIRADVEEMKYVQRWSRKRGVVRRTAGILCSLILLFRLSTALRNVCCSSSLSSSTTTTTEPFPLVERFLAYTTDYEHAEQVAQIGSVVITAILSVSQLRTFFNVATALQRRVMKTCCCGSSSASSSRGILWWTQYSYTVGWLLNCYSLACVVLTKQLLVVRSDSRQQNRIDRYMVDLFFCTSAIVSAAVLAIVLGILRANSQRYLAESSSCSISPRGLVEV